MSTPEIYINSVSAGHMNHNKYRSSLEQSCIAANLHHLSNQKQRKSARKTSHESCETAATTEESPLELHNGYSHNNLNVLSDDDNRRSSSSSVQPQTESLNSFKSGNRSKKGSLLDTNKYKTEMCKKWQTVGNCPYGKKCRFAHGRDELHDKILSNKKKYKSERCQSFYTTMTCPYGSRCLFAHEERCLKDILVDYQKTLNDSNLKRLPCFAKLKTDDNSYNDALLMKTLEREMEDILSFTH